MTASFRPAEGLQVRGAAKVVYVRSLSGSVHRGLVEVGGCTMPCALGRGGMRARKQEGDGATPRGAWAIRNAVYRPDRMPRPATGVPLRAIDRDDGWCDAASDRNYNRPVRHPYPASAERMWRDDGLYDLVLVLGYNDRPRVRGKGSAIFMHVARPGYAPTEGCVALSMQNLKKVAAVAGPRTRVRIG